MRFRVTVGSTVCSVAGQFWGHLGYRQWRDMTEAPEEREAQRARGERGPNSDQLLPEIDLLYLVVPGCASETPPPRPRLLTRGLSNSVRPQLFHPVPATAPCGVPLT